MKEDLPSQIMKLSIKTTPIRMATIKFKNKTKQIVSVGDHVKKLELLCTVGETLKWCSCYGK